MPVPLSALLAEDDCIALALDPAELLPEDESGLEQALRASGTAMIATSAALLKVDFIVSSEYTPSSARGKVNTQEL
ncbi:hypothetical protein [Renibacterium salmoninarum]|uniref:hypothetical protein n=1 Tax=Renibacterium salmoninarum TaxID=1646 RepID=UPI0005A0149F|nr:hypothetical protein [Renibacterium salmoninarum]